MVMSGASILRKVFKKRAPKRLQAGFTLIEVLVSMVVAGFVISGLMFLVVDLLRTDQRELTLEQTQQDMKRALDYIADDLREAIFVYDNPTPLVTALNATASALPAGAQPVLVFWKVNTLNEDANDYTKLSTPGTASCNGLSGDPLANCRALLVRHSYYELVVYYSTDDPDPTWEGAARIYRYSVPEYSRNALTDAATTLAVNDVYVENTTVSPVQGGSPSPQFLSWTPNTAGADSGNSAALVDYVADLTTGVAPTCEAGYTQFPAANLSISFYVCVRPRDAANDLLNQDVTVYLKGNADPAGDSLSVRGISENSELPTLQTRVLVRGVTDKDLLEE